MRQPRLNAAVRSTEVALLLFVSMKKGELSMALMLWALGPFGLWSVASGAHLSIACGLLPVVALSVLDCSS